MIKHAAQVSPSYAVTYWDDEKNFYNYDTNTCSAPTDMTCAHYTQVCQLLLIYAGCIMKNENTIFIFNKIINLKQKQINLAMEKMYLVKKVGFLFN